MDPAGPLAELCNMLQTAETAAMDYSTSKAN